MVLIVSIFHSVCWKERLWEFLVDQWQKLVTKVERIKKEWGRMVESHTENVR